MRLNWKVLSLLAVAAVAAVAVYPPLLAFAPFLLLAACPLLMALMGGHAAHTMRSGGAKETSEAECHKHDEPEALPADRLGLLEERLRAVNEEQKSLAREAAGLRDAKNARESHLLREAEEVARAAADHPPTGS